MATSASPPPQPMAAQTRDAPSSMPSRPPALRLPQLDSIDEASGDDGLYNDDALMVMQPALSATATRLTLPKTPAAEKAAAMDALPGEPFFASAVPSEGGSPASLDSATFATPMEIPRRSSSSRRQATGDQLAVAVEGTGPDHYEPVPLPTTPKRTFTEVYSEQRSKPPRRHDSLPTPWRSTDVVAAAEPYPAAGTNREGQARRALESISFGQTRQKRSGSAGTEAFKRWSKALPSFPNPSNFLSSFSNTLFPPSPTKSESSPDLVGPSPTRSQRSSPPPALQQQQQQPRGLAAGPDSSSVPVQRRRPHSSTVSHPSSRPQQIQRQVSVSADGRVMSPLSTVPAKPRSIRRTTSDDSLLYHSLSRVSSLGDDNRFENVREMTNVRMKAIRDSLPERPSFKMPSMPSMPKFNSHLKMFSAYDEPTITPVPEAPAANNGSDTDAATALDRVLETLTGDLVILGGYRGSVLRSAEPPYQQLWAPVKIGFNLRQADLEVGLSPEDEETMEERIIPSGMLQNIGPIDISRKLFKKVRSCDNARKGTLRVWDYGYDWRLSPHLLSKKMTKFLEGLPSNQPSYRGPKGALVIAHSLGGVITRHVVNQRPDLFSGVLYVGVPQRCINVLGPLRNGDAVLLNEKILTAQVNFSLRTTFAFLPEDGFCFIDKETKEEYNIDFYNPDDWVKYRLSPCLMPALPALTPKPPTGFGSRLRNRSVSEKRPSQFLPSSFGEAAAAWKAEFGRDKALNPQLDSNRPPGPGSAAAGAQQQQQEDPSNVVPSFLASGRQPSPPPSPTDPTPSNQAANVAYLRRILPEIKRFRAELAYNPEHSRSNAYPPIGLMYGKSTPTVYAAQVLGREGIACADTYDNLVFRPGDGVVLAREAQLPEGYELVQGGRVCTERGHLTMLGDMPSVGRALEAVVRGRRKGIGLGDAAKWHN